jgi:hypothetical protein
MGATHILMKRLPVLPGNQELARRALRHLGFLDD